MDPRTIIDSYVSDVVRHLPRRERQDVGFELRSLLNEDLDGRAADSGRPADATMTVELLTAFGRPQDVADRYRPAGFTIIRPADAPRFARLALGGVALQWAVTLPAALLGPAQTGDWAYGAGDWWGRLSIWWLSWGLGSFWWPGFLITVTLISAWLGHRRGRAKPWTPRREVDRDLINRPAIVLALAFWMAGATVLIALPWLGALAPGLPRPLLDALLLDPDFLRWRAPFVVLLWAGYFGLYGAVLLAGRWSRVTRRINLGISAGMLVLILWWLAAGRIFQVEAADDVVKLALLLIVPVLIVDIVATLRRTAEIRPPTVRVRHEASAPASALAVVWP